MFLSKSRNQLSTLPVHLCSLPLKVLIASNNKLVSIPEEIGLLRQLTELVSMHLIFNDYYCTLGLRKICVCHSVSNYIWFCIDVLEKSFKYSEILKEFYMRERCTGEQMSRVNLNVFPILERKAWCNYSSCYVCFWQKAFT